MLASILCVLGGFAFAVWRAFRKQGPRAEAFAPEGKLRWTDDPARASGEAGRD